MTSKYSPLRHLADSVSRIQNDGLDWKPKLELNHIHLYSKKKPTLLLRSCNTIDVLDLPLDLHEGHNILPLDMVHDVLIRFDTAKYPLQKDFGNIIQYVKKQAVLNGYKLNHNGVKNNVLRLQCTHAQNFKVNENDKRYDTDPRESPQRRNVSVSSNRKNNRVNGKTEGRLTSTRKSVHCKCCFAVTITQDRMSYIFQPQKNAKTKIHTGHQYIHPFESSLRKSEIGPEEERRMVEDASVAVSTKITVRVLNSISGPCGPLAPYSLVREFRASNILQTGVNGSKIQIDKSKSFMDLSLEFLRTKNARIVYLASYPTISDKLLTLKAGNSSNTEIVCSRPQNVNMTKFTLVCRSVKMGIVVEDGDILTMLRVKEVQPDSPLKMKMHVGDYICSMNNKSMMGMTIYDFQKYIGSLPPGIAKVLLVYRRVTEEHDSTDVLTTQDAKEILAPQMDLNVSTQESHSLQCGMEVKSLVENLIVKADKAPVFTGDMLSGMGTFVRNYRTSGSKSDVTCRLFVSLGWLLPCQLNVSLLYANCIFVDSTHNVTIHQNYKQFSVCVKDSNGNVYTVCRIGVPHEKVCMLTYIMQVCLPSLFGPQFVKRVRRVICDGDPLLCAAIDRAIKTTFVKASRGRCGFHIVFIGFDKNCRGYIRYHENVPDSIRSDFEKLIQTWLYSWMRPIIFTKEEYELSKSILLQWIQSDEVLENICDQASIDLLVRWIWNGVIVHEDFYVFYNRSDIFAMDSYTNCGIEGTHNALKNGSISVGKHDELHEYTKKACDYDESRMRDHYVNAARVLRNTKLYGELWMNHLTDKGAKMAYNTIQRSEHYVSEIRHDDNGSITFYVMIGKSMSGGSKEEEEEHEYNVSVPKASVEKRSEKIDVEVLSFQYRLPRQVRYNHSWIVKLVKDPLTGGTYLVCSCMFYSRCGLLCTHLHHVHHYYFQMRGFAEEIDYHDYHVVWWKFTDYLIRKPVENMTEQEKDVLVGLLHSADNDKRLGLHLRFTQEYKGEKSLLSTNGMIKGDSVNVVSCMRPSIVSTMSVEQRLIGWNWSCLQNERNQNVASSSLEPKGTVEDNFRCKDIDATIDKITSHQIGKKETLSKVYGIVDSVDFSQCPRFLEELNGTLDEMYLKAVRINLNGGKDLSGDTNEVENSVLQKTGFLGTVGMSGSVYNKRKTKLKKGSRKRRNIKDKDIVAP